MAPSTPTSMSASTSTTAVSPSTAQTTPTHSNNGESSTKTKPQQQQTKPQQSKPAKAKAGDGEAGKSKSAKELAKEAKKEKRAALVAARGGGEEGDVASSGQPHPHSTKSEKVSIDGTPHSHSHPNSAGMSSSPSNSTTSQHQRPSLFTADSTFPQIAQSSSLKQEGFYSHVVTHKHPDTKEAFNSSRIHPLVIRLGVLMANGELRGANARTIGMMSAFKEVIRDYETPENVVMWKDLMSHLSPMISFLEGCRPKGTGGGNAIR